MWHKSPLISNGNFWLVHSHFGLLSNSRSGAMISAGRVLCGANRRRSVRTILI
jgi:hypothetical protein